MPPVWFQKAGYILLVVIVGLMARELYIAIRHRNHWYESLYTVVGLLWGLGLGFKVIGVGPEWVRFWLADVGFPLLIGWALWDVTRGRGYRASYAAASSHLARLYLVIEKVAERKRTLLVAVGLSYAYEVVSGVLVSMAKKNAPPDAWIPVGGFDWLDILAYTCGGMIGLWILARWTRRLESWRDDVYKWDVADRMARARGKASERASAQRGRSTRKKKRPKKR